MNIIKTRIVRADGLNLAVEELRTITNKKTGESREEWVEVGYYGPGNVQFAIRTAMVRGVPVGDCVTLEAIQEAVKQVIENTNVSDFVKDPAV